MRKSCALLLSRQALRPCATTPWIQALLRAAQWTAHEGLVVNTSIGVPTWDAITVAASRVGARMRVFLAAQEGAPERMLPDILRDLYGLDPARTEVVFVACEPGKRGMAARDNAVADDADTLVPISVRDGGTMANRLANAGKTCRIDSFDCGYTRRKSVLKRDCIIAPSVGKRSWTQDYLFHWTRASNGPWPGETPWLYWNAVFNSSTYPRGAFETLRNILATGRIVASDRHMPGNEPCVSLTAKPPLAFAPLMRWRARYREMSFEPYGIGITRAAAKRNGVQPVVYGCGEERTPVWLRQSDGNITKWSDEEEWRCRGDLALAGLAKDAVMCVCETAGECSELAREFTIECVPYREC